MCSRSRFGEVTIISESINYTESYFKKMDHLSVVFGLFIGLVSKKIQIMSSFIICLVVLCVLRDRWHLHQPEAVRPRRRDCPRDGYETFLWH